MRSTPRSGPISCSTPMATAFSESMSRPESVSSSTAMSGSSTASWRISFFFFSPPEKPWFTYRFTMASSTPRRFIFSFMCFRKASAEISSAFTALYAVRRKFTTETPGTSTGYCMARNRPRWARWSGRRARMFSPLNRTSPDVTWYPGRPISTFARVDLPDPFGPISAWVCPCFTTRSIPLRISLPSTEACSPRISSVAVATAVSVIRHLDHHVVALHLHVEPLHRLRGRERDGLAGVEVERGTVLGALDRPEVHVHLALVQEVVRVRADRVDHPEPLLAQVHHGERAVVHLEPPDFAGRHVRGAAHAHPTHSILLRKLGLDGPLQAGPDLLQVHPVQDLPEEPEHDQALRLLQRDPPAHQVEQLVLVHRPHACGVAAPRGVVGEDLQVRHGMRPCGLRQQDVPVGLVGVASMGTLLDDHGAGVDGVRAALHRALVQKIARGPRSHVVLERSMVDVLVAVPEVQAEHLARAAVLGQQALDLRPGQRATEGDAEPSQVRVARDASPLNGQVRDPIAPLLEDDVTHP